MKCPINSGFPLRRLLLRDYLCRDNLKGERDRRYQSKNRVNNRCVSKTFRAKESRNHNVICEIDAGCQARPREQYHAPRDNASLQRLCLLGQTVPHTLEAVALRAKLELVKLEA